jgi:hypothetical protein
MALIKYGGGIIQMSGSLAGNTFARNRYGNYCRARTKPTNPNTALQVAVREAIAYLTNRWSQTLTAAQRTAWNLYASSVAMKNKLGETTYLSGFNHYIRSNVNSIIIDQPAIDAGPTVFELPDQDPTFVITASEATQNISAAFDNTMDWAVEDGSFLFMWQGQPQNPQRNFFAGPWRFWTAVQGVDPGGPATPKEAPAVFAIAEGQRLWAYARICRADGRLSEVFRSDCFCAA